MKRESIVAVSECGSYDEKQLAAILRSHFAVFGYDRAFFEGKRVVIKPNLVMKKSPDAAATTHPAVLGAVLCVLGEMGVAPVIAESPGGIYNRQRLEGIYRVCGIAETAQRYGAQLNYDTSAVHVPFAEGRKVKMFHIISPIVEADVIIDLCKLKSHSLTKMSAAVKNLFGTIPGIEKFEMHATFPEYGDFGAMLCDLCELLCREKTVIAVTDACTGAKNDTDVNIVDGDLFGSKLCMNQAARNFRNKIGLTEPEVFRVCALNAARALGMDKDVGSLAAGKQANIVLLDPAYQVREVFLRAEHVVQGGKLCI